MGKNGDFIMHDKVVVLFETQNGTGECGEIYNGTGKFYPYGTTTI